MYKNSEEWQKTQNSVNTEGGKIQSPRRDRATMTCFDLAQGSYQAVSSFPIGQFLPAFIAGSL